MQNNTTKPVCNAYSGKNNGMYNKYVSLQNTV